ncbi:CapA family protein [Paracoccus denitrificans]|uniref:CapA family protein n=1 Tax=Paracoccus denitrificans TaxID=266 RepID=UPI001E59E2D8|nr:CapA family protein [Paracoccus denitrificans]UFS65716.1 CapA family protein [Paracoccus denitrificans]
MNRDDQTAKPVTIAWGGDVNIGRRFHYRFRHTHGRDALARIMPLVEADLRIVNLECVVATCGEECVDKGERSSYYFRARPEMLETLLRGGVDLVTTANNHSGDYGPVALVEQAAWLDMAGIGHAGAGRNREEAFRPVIRRAGHLDVALFALDATQQSFAAGESSPGTAWLDPAKPAEWAALMAPRIAAARELADIVLVAIHWGRNNLHQPDALEIAGGHALIDAGADAVLGASAHLLQGVEVYKDRPILHDAGDLLFDALTRGDEDSGIFTLEIDHRGVSRVAFLPLEVGFCRTVPLAQPAATEAVQRFAGKCAALGTRMEIGEDGRAHLDLTPPDRIAGPSRPPAAPVARRLPAALGEPRPEWLADDVPSDALLPAPLRIGALELLGLRVSPERLDRIGLIAVESWWRLVEPVDCDWRIDFRADPEKPGPIGAWGLGCSHDPCDWMWPVSRWEPGRIYRDFYTLRPSSVRDWVDETLMLSVGLVSHLGKTERHVLPKQIRFELSPKAGFAVLRSNPPRYDVPPPDKISPTPEILWTAEQLEQVTGGKWLVPPSDAWFVCSVTHKSRQLDNWNVSAPKLLAVIDRRMAMKHELSDFTAGKHWDIHDQLPALQGRIAAAMVARPVEGLAPGFPLLQVPDPLHALIQLGVAGRNRLKGHVVAVTGSAGKTSQSLMLMAAMAKDRKVIGNSALNYNSRVGILHLLANTPPSTDLVVVEAAVTAINAPKFQNIRLMRPDIGLVTNIAPSHMQRSGQGLETVARRKANLVEGIAPGGTLLLNREIDFYDVFLDRAKQRDLCVVTFGAGEDADLRLVGYDQATGRVKARLPGGGLLDYRISAPGRHMAMNSLACIGVRLLLGGDLAPFLEGLEEFQPAEGRGAVSRVEFEGCPLTVVDDSYNANPVSMQAALSTFAGMKVAGRRILILGDMAELGKDASRYHRGLAAQILKIRPDEVLLCGPLMQELWDELSKSGAGRVDGAHYPRVEVLLSNLAGHLRSGDTVLLKASNSVGLGRIMGRFVKHG